MSETATIPRRPGRPVDPDRVERRRATILESAARVFGRGGFEQADVSDIAREAGLSKGAVYHYFDSKEALFFATVDREVGKLRDAVIAASEAESDPYEEFRAVVYTYLQFFADNPGAVELIIEERASFREREEHTYFKQRDMTMDRWVELFERVSEARAVRVKDARAAVEFVSNVLYGTVFTNYFLRVAPSPHEQADQILDIVWNGILEMPST